MPLFYLHAQECQKFPPIGGRTSFQKAFFLIFERARCLHIKAIFLKLLLRANITSASPKKNGITSKQEINNPLLQDDFYKKNLYPKSVQKQPYNNFT